MIRNLHSVAVLVTAIAVCSLCIGQANAQELTVVDPNGGENLVAGSTYTITWQSQGGISDVNIEYSNDDGSNWTQVNPNASNTGSYDWLVPQVTSNQCLVSISDTADPGVGDVSDETFIIYECPLAYDLDHNCSVDFFDFALLASEWLQSGGTLYFFNYTIEADGTEDITIYPDQHFNWTVTTTGTETWTEYGGDNAGGVSCYGYHLSCTHYLYPSDGSYEIYNWNYTNSQSGYGGRDNGTFIDTSANKLVIRTYSGGDENEWCCGGWLFGNCLGWCTDYLNGHWSATYHVAGRRTATATVTSTESGSATVNATEGNKFIANFSLAPPPPQHGGTVTIDSRTITDDNPNVITSIIISATGEVYASTSYSQVVTQPWSDTEAGIAAVSTIEGDKYITTSTFVAPNGDTTWSVTDDNPFVDTWMLGNELYANVP